MKSRVARRTRRVQDKSHTPFGFWTIKMISLPPTDSGQKITNLLVAAAGVRLDVSGPPQNWLQWSQILIVRDVIVVVAVGFLVSVIKFKLLSLVFIKMVLYGAHEILFSCLLKASWGQAKPSQAEPSRTGPGCFWGNNSSSLGLAYSNSDLERLTQHLV